MPHSDRRDDAPLADAAQRTLDATTSRRLAAEGWTERAGERLALWVSVAEQRLRGLRGDRVEFDYICSTAANGVGQEADSYRTPLGWHEIAKKIGAGLPSGAVLKDRVFTGEILGPNDDNGRRGVLTRILWLRGLEPGHNAGPGVDSFRRYIYIHGTAAEAQLGTPASAGCVCLSSRDVIELFERVPVRTLVLMTEW